MFNRVLVITLIFWGMCFDLAWATPDTTPLKPIFFEEGWQDTPDWSSGTLQRDWPSSFAIEQGGTCTTNCPPSGWTGYSHPAQAVAPLEIKNDINCSDALVPQQSKCLIYSVITEGDYGAWHGGRLGKLFSKPEGYEEIIVRMRVKFGPVWQWADCPGCGPGNSTGNQVSMIKNIRIGRFWGDLNSVSMFNTQGCNDSLVSNPSCYSMPIAIPDTLENPYYYYADPFKYRKNVASILSFRVDPSYKYSPYDGKSPAQGGNPAPYFPEDGDWHTLEYRVKMNSAPGVLDGEFEMWIDNSTDTLTTWNHYKATDVPWLNTDALHLTPKWNSIWMPDNMSRFYNGTQQIYYGPVIAYEPLTNDPLSTDADLWSRSPGDGRLPFDYVIGGDQGDLIAPAVPSGLSVE